MYTNKIQKLLDRQQISQLVEVVVECNSETITGIIILLLLLFIYLFIYLSSGCEICWVTY